MQAISHTTESGSFEVLDRPAIISVTGKKTLDRALAVVESTGNNRALRKILVGEAGVVGKTMARDTVNEGWSDAIEAAANGEGYSAFIGKVALALKRAMRNDRKTYLKLVEYIDDELLQVESGNKKMSDKAQATLRSLRATIVEAQALVEARYQELKAAKDAAAFASIGQ